MLSELEAEEDVVVFLSAPFSFSFSGKSRPPLAPGESPGFLLGSEYGFLVF
ncbi:MAG: hypothetical protein AB3K77_14455 [Methanosarcinaceae archaeon]|uniref:hypothetical protein n=1 Tax=unclassified Methanosarcina TaxID=2644672 RepID=UPI0012E03A4F|nr:hypothetical protein [Methanosarcina sp. MTP4]